MITCVALSPLAGARVPAGVKALKIGSGVGQRGSKEYEGRTN